MHSAIFIEQNGKSNQIQIIKYISSKDNGNEPTENSRKGRATTWKLQGGEKRGLLLILLNADFRKY